MSFEKLIRDALEAPDAMFIEPIGVERFVVTNNPQGKVAIFMFKSGQMLSGIALSPEDAFAIGKALVRAGKEMGAG